MFPFDDNPDEIARRIRRTVGASSTDWAATRSRFAVRAEAEDLIDVAFEDHETPLGPIRLGATRAGIVRVGLPSEDHDAVLEQLAQRISVRALRSSTATITLARRELDEYFEGRRRTFDVPLDWALSQAFRRKVLRATTQIPYGRVSTYKGVAVAAGSPGAVRAAGSALANNPLPILVPCHRVLRSDGSLGQYLGGPAAKSQLLALEKEA